jgi:hypothetical protein
MVNNIYFLCDRQNNDIAFSDVPAFVEISKYTESTVLECSHDDLADIIAENFPDEVTGKKHYCILYITYL